MSACCLKWRYVDMWASGRDEMKILKGRCLTEPGSLFLFEKNAQWQFCSLCYCLCEDIRVAFDLFFYILVLEMHLDKSYLCTKNLNYASDALSLAKLMRLIRFFKLKSPFEQWQPSCMCSFPAPGKQKNAELILKNCFHWQDYNNWIFLRWVGLCTCP